MAPSSAPRVFVGASSNGHAMRTAVTLVFESDRNMPTAGSGWNFALDAIKPIALFFPRRSSWRAACLKSTYSEARYRSCEILVVMPALARPHQHVDAAWWTAAAGTARQLYPLQKMARH
jgi:hypothetical protein